MKNQFVIVNVRLELVKPNPYQTRLAVDAEHVAELAADILANGLLEVPAGRRIDENGNPLVFGLGDSDIQLAYGHNRLAAFQLLNSNNPDYGVIPIKIVDYSDEQMAITAWSENESRKQLNPVEKALAVKKLIERFNWTQAEVAEKIRVERSTVTNLLRLLKLPEDVLNRVFDGTLSQRQASALIPYYELTAQERNRFLTEITFDQGYQSSFDDFIAAALDGSVDSDSIRERISSAISIIHPDPEQFKFDGSADSTASTGSATGSATGGSPTGSGQESQPPAFQQPQERKLQTAWLQKDIEGRDLPPVADALNEDESPLTPSGEGIPADGHPLLPIETTLVRTSSEGKSMDEDEGVNSGEGIPPTPLPEGGQASTPAPNSGAVPGEVASPKTWEESTYTLVMNFLAVDGNADGRNVMVSLRANQGMPAFYQMRESLMPLPWRLEGFVRALRESFQGAAQVSSEVEK